MKLDSLGKDSLLTIWVIPNKEEVSLILDCKQTIDKELMGPDFPIHMTLAVDFDLNEEVSKDFEKKISGNLFPFEINFEGFGMKDYFFQAFFVKVDLDKNLKLIRSKACELLKIKNSEFMPHLSLYYGKEKKEIKKSLLPKLPKIKGSLMVKELYLVSFDPNNIEWKILNRLNLGG